MGLKAMAIKIQPRKLTETKAWLFGFLAGDGHVKAAFGAGFNTDPDLVAEIERALSEVYGIDSVGIPRDRPGRKRIWIVRFGRPIAEDLLRHSPSWHTLQWRVPNSVVQDSRPEIKAAWARGFFDAEGSAYGSPKWRVSAGSANQQGLLDVSELLDSLSIEHKFYTYPRNNGELPAHVISVHKRSEAIKFAEVVGFHASVKQQRLQGIREAPYGKNVRWKRILPQIHELKAQGLKQYEIDERLGLYKHESTNALCWERRKAGIKNRRDSLGPLYEEVSVLRDEGLSISQAAKALGIPNHRVAAAFSWWRKKAVIPKKISGSIYTGRMVAIREAGLAEAGAPTVAEALGITEKQVWDARKWTAKKNGTYQERVNPSDHAEAIRSLREMGAKQSDIARVIGCSQATVSNFCRKHGIAPVAAA